MKKVMALGSVFVMAAALSMGCEKAHGEDLKLGEAKAKLATGITECDSFVATSEKVLNCEKLPKEDRDMQAQSLVRQKARWAALRAPDVTVEARHAAADRCKQADDAMKRVWTHAGCE